MSLIYVHKHIFPIYDIAQTVAGAVNFQGTTILEIDSLRYQGDGEYILFKGMTQSPYASGLNNVVLSLPPGVINDTIYYDSANNAIKVQLSGD
jgi:hypothetical protein